jgi:polyhydroxyalkanoate synthesis regulator phasin
MDNGMDNGTQPTMQERLVDLRNDAIIQAANLYLFGRNALLAGVGAAALAKDQAGALLERCVERGELAEADVQQLVGNYRSSVEDQVKAADQARANLTEQARVTLDENLRIIASVLGHKAQHPPQEIKVTSEK